MVRCVRYKFAGVVLLTAALVGCAGTPTTRPTTEPSATSAPVMSVVPENLTPAAVSMKGADGPKILQLDVYQMWVPAGTLSNNEAFWKRIEEHAVDVATYDLLFKNGIRVGSAPRTEWPTLKAMIDQNPATVQHTAYLASDTRVVELETGVTKETQNIFYYDASNTLQGRTHDKAQNLMALTFRPVPRQVGDVRVTLCPVVRSTKRRFEVSGGGEEREITYVFPERLYDLNLRADVPADGFLVIAPSTEGRWPMSVGNAFFTKDGPTERLEQIIVLVPSVIQLKSMR